VDLYDELRTTYWPLATDHQSLNKVHEMNDCLFCKIVRGEIPSKKVHEDEYTYAFEDLDPKAPTHVLIVPKKHIRGLKEASEEDADIVGRCHLTAAHIARQRGIEEGYRTVLNVGPKSGQSVFHLHVHLLGGRDLRWPPG
jgi:histidine triad (HIT) family protein